MEKKGQQQKQNEGGLTSVQLTMMSLGSVIGGSFFLGSVVALRAAGPALILSYLLGGALVYIILFALSEMTIADREHGTFHSFAANVYGPGLGFLTGWVYWTGLVLALSSEATAAAILLRIWAPDLSMPVTGFLIIIAVTALNMLGAEKLSKLESGLSVIKLLAIAGFIVLGAMLIIGLFPGRTGIGAGALLRESWLPAGVGGVAGSMLIVMFSYAGFEIISLAAAETANPHQTVPRAIYYTVISLIGLYVTAVLIMLPLIPVNSLTESASPLVQALTRWNLDWAGRIMNLVLLTAIFSTMLAAMFGLGRMIRSLADEGQAPGFLQDRGEIPYKGILFSGGAMAAAMLCGFLLPDQVYIFLVSSGGFSLLFTYLIILFTHHKFRRQRGCPPAGKCQLPGYPYTSWIAITGLAAIVISMPLVPGQGFGLLAGSVLVVFYGVIYRLKTCLFQARTNWRIEPVKAGVLNPQADLETARELVSLEPTGAAEEEDKNCGGK